MDENMDRASGKHRFRPGPGRHARPARPLPRRPQMNSPHAEEILVMEAEVFLTRWELDKMVFMNTMGWMLHAAAMRPLIGNWPSAGPADGVA